MIYGKTVNIFLMITALKKGVEDGVGARDIPDKYLRVSVKKGPNLPRKSSV